MICEICKINRATERHHKFAQHKSRVKHYGKIIDADFNIIMVCNDCHISHNKIPKEYIWNEPEFRGAAVRAGFRLPMPMKSFPRRVKII